MRVRRPKGQRIKEESNSQSIKGSKRVRLPMDQGKYNIIIYYYHVLFVSQACGKGCQAKRGGERAGPTVLEPNS